ncbi:putative Ig domain-containing protein [Brenneria izbisi]|uniref:Beta-propeller fold lactonase family protein n=1 Tax=Brenneria izbisi TaxID=2939450 RepID=A0AA41Y0X1_9GAMM|nr:beta-propeller fold lactonase family protein [Brenneria izbisi]MCV9878654.1 beta-propeller fold lactonase family protein [Brenneria izbisi]MCV9882163.1 beta-propeller fold lactonase family protein [Brenneria izbisi]
MTYSRSTARRRLPQQAWALEPRMMFDAAAVATAEAVVAATADAPGVTASGSEATISIDESSTAQNVDLFSGVTVSNDASGEALNSLVITVDSSGDNQALIIDDSAIALTTGSGTTAGNNYFYSVQTSGGSTIITLSIASSEAYAASDVAALIDGLAYSTLDNTVESGTITVTLTSLRDDGGETAELGIHSTIAITSTINVAPVLSDDGALEAAESFTSDELGGSAAVVYSGDGQYAYVGGESGISVFSIDDTGRLTLVQTFGDEANLGAVSQMTLSADGKSIYTLSGGNIITLNVDTDGTLSYGGTTSGENGVLMDLALSDDGGQLYVTTEYNGLVVFTRDGGTGALTPLQTVDESSLGVVRAETVISANGYVFVIGDQTSFVAYTDTLAVLKINDDGTLTMISSVTADATRFSSSTYSMAVSEDAALLYLGNSSGGIQVYRFDGSELILMDSVTLDGVTSIALSGDGSLLYAAASDGTINVYAADGSGNLALASSTVASASGSDIAVSGDGLSVLVAGSGGVTRYSAAQTLVQGSQAVFASGITLADSNFDTLSGGEGNYKGASISVSPSVTGGSFGFADGNDLIYSDGAISLNGSAIATLSESNGALTVTFTADTTSEVANRVLQQIAYGNDSVAVGSYVLLTVAVNDGALTSNSVVVTLRINGEPQVNSDAAAGYALSKATSETAYSFTLFSGLFNDADGDSLTWSVSGLPDGLTFNAATRTISGAATEVGTFTLTVTATDATGASAALDLDLVVEQIVNRAPEVNAAVGTTLDTFTKGESGSITLDGGLFTDADSLYGDRLTWSVSGLPEGLSFDAETLAISGTASNAGDYTITMTATDQSGASAASELTLRVITQAEADNNAPGLVGDASALTYASDGSLSGFSQYVNSITLSDDGTILVIAASTSNNGNGDSYLYVYRRDTSSGELALLQTFTQGTENDGDDANGIELDGLSGITSVSYSSDGSLLYLSGYASTGSSSAYSISVFSVGDEGSLTLVDQVADIAEKVLQIAVAQDSGAFYALSATTVYAYRIGDDGALTAIDAYTPESGFGTAVAMQIDDDGSVYVLSGGRLTVYTVAADGGLSYAGQLTRSGTTLTWRDAVGANATAGTLGSTGAFNGANAFVVSDAGYLYLTTGNGFLTTLQYDRSTNAMSLVDTVSAYSALTQYPHGIAMSQDGTTLYVTSAASSRLVIYTIGEEGKPTYANIVTTSEGISKLVVSADGQSVYGGRNLYFGTPLLSMIGATGVTVTYTEGDTINPIASVVLSDADYDALNGGAGNYNGATITLVRTDGADGNDSYGFTDGNGLTLADGIISLNGAAIATLVSTDGTLTVAFTADVTTATANLVLQQISYTNASSDPGSSISLTLSVADQYASSRFDLLLSVAVINNAPVLETESQNVTYISGGSAVKLFNDSMLSGGEEDQAISAITLTVAGLVDGEHEKLLLNGNYVSLTDGTSLSSYVMVDVVESDGNVNSYTYVYNIDVSVTEGVATVTLSNNEGLPTAVAEAVVNSIAYLNTAYENALEDATTGDRTITLTSIQDNGGTGNGGVDTTALAIGATVTVSLTNSAPVITASDASNSYTEKGAATALFSDVAVSAGEPGQTFINIELTISGLSDGDSEVLVIDGAVVALTADAYGETTNGYGYYVSLEGDTATLYLYSSDGIAVSDATALIAGLAYANQSDDPTLGTRTIRLTTVQDNGGTANGGVDTVSPGIAASVTVVAVNDAPRVSATPVDTLYATVGSSAALFSDVVISTVESDQRISSITFTVSGLVDGSRETLTVGGTRIALIDGSGTLDNGDSYTVALNGDTAIVTIGSASGMAVDAAVSLIEQTSYANLSNTQTAGLRTISLSVQDSGGQDNGGSDTTTLEAVAAIDVVNNSAPEFSAGADYTSLEAATSLTAISGLADIASGTLSPDGAYLYVVSSAGDIAIFSRNTASGELALLQTLDSGVSSVSLIEASDDGGTIALLGAQGDSITLFARNGADGSLTLVQTLTTENVIDLALSADGGALYVVDGNYSGLLVYTLNADSGQYALSQSITAATGSEPYLFTAVGVDVVGDYLYVVTDPVAETVANTLIVYQRAEDGTLAALAWLRDGALAGAGTVDMSSPVDIAVSSDGGTVYVASEDSVAVFSLDVASGALSYLGAVSGLSNVTAIALSGDDGTLYVTGSDSGISRYKSDAGALTLLETLSGASITALADAQRVVSGAHGAVAVIGGGGLVSLNDALTDISLDYHEQGTVVLADVITLSDADYDALADGAGNYNGATITVIREGGADSADSYSIADGNGLTLADGTLWLDGAAIAAFTNNGGALTVTFTAEVTTVIVNQVLQQISYTNTSADPGASIRLVIGVTDAYAAGTQMVAALSVAEVNDAPLLSATPTNPGYMAGDGAVGLFDGVSVSAIENGQSIVALTVTVAGVVDAAESLNIDGTTVMLTDGAAYTTSSGLNVTVTLANGEARLTISGSDGINAAALVEGLAYANPSSTVTSGERVVTLTAIQDDGGTANGGVDRRVLDIAAVVSIANSAPQATDSAASLPQAMYAAAYRAVLSSDWFSDVNGDALTWSIEGLPDGLSFDAATLTISGQTRAVGSFELTLTVSDGQGGTATRFLTLAVDKPPVTPVVLPLTGMPGDMMTRWWEAREDERERQNETISIALRGAASTPAAESAPLSGEALSTSQYPLVNGEIDYADTPWRLEPIMTPLMPALEAVDFSSLRTTNAPVSAAENSLTGGRMPLAESAEGKAAFSAQLHQSQTEFDELLTALNLLTEKRASPTQ